MKQRTTEEEILIEQRTIIIEEAIKSKAEALDILNEISQQTEDIFFVYKLKDIATNLDTTFENLMGEVKKLILRINILEEEVELLEAKREEKEDQEYDWETITEQVDDLEIENKELKENLYYIKRLKATLLDEIFPLLNSILNK